MQQSVKQTLVQRRWFETRTFTINDAGVHFKSQTSSKDFERDISFEQLGSRIITQRGRYQDALIVFSLFIVVHWSVVGATDKIEVDYLKHIFFSLLYVGAGVFWVIRKRDWESFFQIDGGDVFITFLYYSPSPKETRVFIDHIVSSRKKYYLNKYGVIDPDKTRDTNLNNFLWLRDNDFLNQAEYAALKRQLDEPIRAIPPIGLRQHSEDNY